LKNPKKCFILKSEGNGNKKKSGDKMNTLENTKQYTKQTEKARFMIDFKAKKDFDLVLYWHYETIKADLIDEYLKESF
jgi:hypothetical protein